jgi:hypothetical protein
MRDAELLEPGRVGQPMDGEVVIERHRIEFTQVLATGGV